MRVTGSFEVRAPQAAVWDSLWHDDTLTAWIPGCLSTAWQDADHVTARVEQTLALLKAQFEFTLTVAEREAPQHVRLQGGGSAEALRSAIELDMSLDLASGSAPETTRVSYDVEAGVTGTLASIGQFVLQSKAKEMQRALAGSVKGRLEDRT